MRTDGNNANAGTTDSSGGAWLTIEYAAGVVAAGDTVYIRASAGNASSYPTSSLDYSIGSYFTPTAGTAAGGLVKWIGYNGIPTIGAPGLAFYNCDFQYFEGLYLVATAATAGSFGVIHGTNHTVKNCILNLNNQAAVIGLNVSNLIISGGEIYGGTTSPTSSAGSYGIMATNYSALIHGVKIRYCRDHGIYVPGTAAVVRDCLIYRNVGDGINIDIAATVPGFYIGNTIDANKGHGIRINASNGAAWHTIRNNNITNQSQASKYGISVATSSSDKRKRDWGYNNVWNNTSNYENVTADSTDLSVDPTYADAANGDFTPSNATTKVAFPTAFGSVTNELWIGAVQPVASGGGGGLACNPLGGFVL